MDKKILLQNLAKLAVNVGANVQKGQVVQISAPIEAYELVKLIHHEAYLKGAKAVYVDWNDSNLTLDHYTYAPDESLEEVPQFIIEKMKYLVDNNACSIGIDSRKPNALKNVDPRKIMIYNKAIGAKSSFYQEHYGSSKSQWTIVAYPNDEWCQAVFKNLPLEEAWDKLFEAIIKTSRVEGDFEQNWKDHINNLDKKAKTLNDYDFKTLHFKNSLGTDLTIGLVKDHIWAGGGEMGGNGVFFVPNIPTEEVFTMPHKDLVNGIVVSTKPLSYQGTLIEDFSLTFENGKVTDYKARVGYDALKSLIELDEGSSRLGEVALISNDSPISNLNVLFYDTLFDENASCHLALGNAYSMNVKNGVNMNEEELQKLGYNKSITHVDFMFGSSDMEIYGTTYDDKKVEIFKKGNFVF